MSTKVKRGLGLLVIAAIGFLLVNAAHETDGPVLLESAGYLLAAVGLLGGLGLLAWGLLRE